MRIIFFRFFLTRRALSCLRNYIPTTTSILHTVVTTYALLPYYVLLHTTTYLPSPTYCYHRIKYSTALSFSVFRPITLIGLLKELTRLTRLSYGRHCLRNKSFATPTLVYLGFNTVALRLASSSLHSRTSFPTTRNTVLAITTTLLNNVRYKYSTAFSFSVFHPITLIGLLKELTRLTRLSYGRHCLRNKSFDKPAIVYLGVAPL
jgi:hypothetical protein